MNLTLLKIPFSINDSIETTSPFSNLFIISLIFNTTNSCLNGEFENPL